MPAHATDGCSRDEAAAAGRRPAAPQMRDQEPLSTSPNRTQLLPSNLINCCWVIG
jgi:hypothetical protein